MEDNVTINDNYEYNDNPNQQEYDEKKRKRRLLLLLLLLLFSIILVLGVTGLYVEHKGNGNLSNGNLNIDIDGDGIADINIDKGTGKCLVNCSTDNKKPIINIDYNDCKEYSNLCSTIMHEMLHAYNEYKSYISNSPLKLKDITFLVKYFI